MSSSGELLGDGQDGEEDLAEDEDEEKGDDIQNDGMIKVKFCWINLLNKQLT